MLGRLQTIIQRRRLRDPRFDFLFYANNGDELVCVDTETTGLDPRTAELLSIGAVVIRGNQVLTSNMLELFVRPEGEIDAESIKIHRIRHQDAESGLPVRAALEAFLDFLGSRPLVGYYLEFDVAMLNKHLKPWLGIGLPNQQIEVSAQYYDKRIGRIPTEANIDLSFDTIRETLGVPRLGEHDACNDALMTALMYVKLQNIKRITRLNECI